MRRLATLLIALATLAWHAPEAAARTSSEPAQSRAQASQPARAAAARAATVPRREAAAPQRRDGAGAGRASPRQTAGGQPPAQRATAARGTRQVAASGGREPDARTGCRDRNCGTQRRAVAWPSGLKPPTHAQAQSCPAGTLATLATGHTDIVRCLPL
jgi:hypothetical protein